MLGTANAAAEPAGSSDASDDDAIDDAIDDDDDAIDSDDSADIDDAGGVDAVHAGGAGSDEGIGGIGGGPGKTIAGLRIIGSTAVGGIVSAGCGNSDGWARCRWRSNDSKAGPRRALKPTSSPTSRGSRWRMPPSAYKAPTGRRATTIGTTSTVFGRRRPSQPKTAALPAPSSGLSNSGDGDDSAWARKPSAGIGKGRAANCRPSEGPERCQPTAALSRTPKTAAKGKKRRA